MEVIVAYMLSCNCGEKAFFSSKPFTFTNNLALTSSQSCRKRRNFQLYTSQSENKGCFGVIGLEYESSSRSCSNTFYYFAPHLTLPMLKQI